MSNSLPTPGGDENSWGAMLNDYLLVSHNQDGTLQTAALQQAGGVTSVNNVAPVNGDVTLSAGNFTANNATPSTPGLIQLTGDIGGSATAPTVVSTHLSAPLPLAQGGTGSTTQNFVDLTSGQTIAGAKTFSTQVVTPALKVSTGPTAGYILTSDSTGNASWQATSTPAQANFTTSGIVKQMVYNIMDYGASTGSSDNTTAIQNALNAAHTAGGGIVFIPPGTFVASNLTIHGQTTLQGTGKDSVLQAKSGTSGSFIALNTPSADIAVVIQNIMIDANNQSGLNGIYFNNTGVAQNSLHRFDNVWVYNAPGVGIYLGPAVIETNLWSCFVFNCGTGYQTDVGATDNRLIECTAGQIVGHGFFVQGNNTHFTDCKAYYCGYNQSGGTWNNNYHGFYLYPSANQDLHVVVLTACEAQNNSQDGFHFEASASNATMQHITVEGCLADGNNEANNSGAGFYINGVTYSTFSNNTTRSQTTPHAYGAAIYHTVTGVYFGPNDFNGSVANVYVDSSVSNLNTVGVYPGSVIPATFPGGVDAPFGSAVVRLVNNASGGNVQLVAPNGGISAYAGGNDVIDISNSGATVNSPYTLSLGEPLAVSSGGTGSSTQNFLDLTTTQTTTGQKTFSSGLNVTLGNAMSGSGAGLDGAFSVLRLANLSTTHPNVQIVSGTGQIDFYANSNDVATITSTALTINSTYKLATAAFALTAGAAAGKVLTSDSSGNGTWVSPGALR